MISAWSVNGVPIYAIACPFILFVVLQHIWHKVFSLQGLPREVPWVGGGNGFFSRGRASFKSLFGLREMLDDGYKKYSRREREFILPNIITGHELILPMSQMKWLLEQPESILNQHEVNKQFLCAEYTMLHPKIIGETTLSNFVRREMTRDLDKFADDVVDEIEASLEDMWGTDEYLWSEVDLYEVMLKIIGRLVNRVLVGPELCRDDAYLRCSTGFSKYIVLTAGFINLLPTILKPIFGPLITLCDTIQYQKLARIITPVIKERLSSSPPEKPWAATPREPNDFIDWALKDTLQSADAAERSPAMITKWLAVLSFAAIQSSAITITNALVDIAYSSSSLQIQEELRMEASLATSLNRYAISPSPSSSPPSSRSPSPRKPSKPKPKWSRSTLALMTKHDSLLRESLRLWGFVSHGVTKFVAAKEGIVLPSGLHLPRGTKVGISSYGPQHDESTYTNQSQFQPWRFCENACKAVGGPPQTFLTTTESYMGFSHGRHACPGRFFASQQLKLLLAHIALRYDIEPLRGSRPQNPWLNNTVGPPLGAKLRVRRRV